MSYERTHTEHRDDVRHRLLKAGWREANGVLTNGRAVFASIGRRRDSILRLAPAHPDFAIEFSSEIPASVIVAACTAAAREVAHA